MSNQENSYSTSLDVVEFQSNETTITSESTHSSFRTRAIGISSGTVSIGAGNIPTVLSSDLTPIETIEVENNPSSSTSSQIPVTLVPCLFIRRFSSTSCHPDGFF